MANFCPARKFAENLPNFRNAYCCSWREFSSENSLWPIIRSEISSENSLFPNFPSNFPAKICCFGIVSVGITSEHNTRMYGIESNISLTPSSAFLSNLPCKCPDKIDLMFVLQSQGFQAKSFFLKAPLHCEIFRATCLAMCWRRCGRTSWRKHFTV